MSSHIEELQTRLEGLVAKSKSLKQQALTGRGKPGFTAETRSALLAQRPAVKAEIFKVTEELNQLLNNPSPEPPQQTDIIQSQEVNQSGGSFVPTPQPAITQKSNIPAAGLIIGGIIVIALLSGLGGKKRG